MDKSHHIDVLIIGGGIAGLWLLDELRRADYSVLLVEKHALGSGQTVAAQGILHGGLKHLLTGRSDVYAKTLSDMPDLWRACLNGERQPDLQDVSLRGNHCYCWPAQSLGGRVGMLGVRVSLRAPLTAAKMTDRPKPLMNHPEVYRVDEQVLDPRKLLRVLAKRNKGHIIHVSEMEFPLAKQGDVNGVIIHSADAKQTLRVTPHTVVLTAGEGNEALRIACGLPARIMRRHPLPILVVKGDLPRLNGFCIERTKAKAIITTHRVDGAKSVWQVACENIDTLPPGIFIAAAMHELKESLPGFDWPRVESSMYMATRAEPDTDGHRSNDAFCEREGNVITAWPSKLVLAPRLSSLIRQKLPPRSGLVDVPRITDGWPQPSVASYPW